MRTLLSWLIALALLVMPAIMAPAASAAHTHGAAASSLVSKAPPHCPDQPSRHGLGASECAMTCAATLPPTEPRAAGQLAFVAPPVAALEPAGLTGQPPAPDIPPPKQA